MGWAEGEKCHSDRSVKYGFVIRMYDEPLTAWIQSEPLRTHVRLTAMAVLRYVYG